MKAQPIVLTVRVEGLWKASAVRFVVGFAGMAGIMLAFGAGLAVLRALGVYP